MRSRPITRRTRLEAKETEFQAAAFGMTGLETAIGVVAAAMVETGRLDWAGVADRMSVRPAKIARITGGSLEVGSPASLTLIDPKAHWLVDPTQTASRSRNNPFAGRTLPARVVATWLRGRPTVIDGKPA